MTRRFRLALLAALACWLAAANAALAHPHVWVTMKSELTYAPDGAVTGVRHAWSFDEMFSTFATQGLETKQKGVFTREDLKPLAEVNVNSLKEYDFFTHAKANGKKTAFNDPVDYWLEFADGLLTLHFTLPLKSPVRAQAPEEKQATVAHHLNAEYREMAEDRAKHHRQRQPGSKPGCRRNQD